MNPSFSSSSPSSVLNLLNLGGTRPRHFEVAHSEVRKDVLSMQFEEGLADQRMVAALLPPSCFFG